jgi:hypothetical protein
MFKNLLEKLGLIEKVGITGKVRIITSSSYDGEILRATEFSPNIVVVNPDLGKNLIAQRLAGINTYSLNLSYGEIGSGSTVPTAGDTSLQTPVARAPLALGNHNLTTTTVQYFFPNANLANGTYKEFGTFVDGSNVLGSGQLFNHVLFTTPYTKGAGEDTTVQVIFTIN